MSTDTWYNLCPYSWCKLCLYTWYLLCLYSWYCTTLFSSSQLKLSLQQHWVMQQWGLNIQQELRPHGPLSEGILRQFSSVWKFQMWRGVNFSLCLWAHYNSIHMKNIGKTTDVVITFPPLASCSTGSLCELHGWWFVFTLELLGSVWTKKGRELANRHCGANAASLCEEPHSPGLTC